MPSPRRDIVSRSESLKRWPTPRSRRRRAAPPPGLRPTSARRRSRCAATPVLRTRRSLRARVHRARTIPSRVRSRRGTSDPTRSEPRSWRRAADRPRSMASRCARVHASVDSSSWPVKYAASASFSRSSRSSGVAASAVANCSRTRRPMSAGRRTPAPARGRRWSSSAQCGVSQAGLAYALMPVSRMTQGSSPTVQAS